MKFLLQLHRVVQLFILPFCFRCVMSYVTHNILPPITQLNESHMFKVIHLEKILTLNLSAFWIDNGLSSSGDLELVCILNWQWSKFFWWPWTCLHSELTMVLGLLVTLNLSSFWIVNGLSSSGDLELVCILNWQWS